MKHEFWHGRWQTNDIGFNQAQVNDLLINYFPTLNLKQGARVFVPLCGKSIDMLWLLQQDCEVIGIELSEVACEAFFVENNIAYEVTETDKFKIYRGDNIIIYAGDFFALNKQMLGKIDAVYDRAALIALPAVMREQYAAHLLSLMDAETKMLLITMSYNQDESEGPPFSVDENEVKKLYAASCSVSQLYHKHIARADLSERMLRKGLTSAVDQVYCLQQMS